MAPTLAPEEIESPAKLDVVVLYTTERWTRKALVAARRMACELHPRIRLVKVVPVSYHLPLDAPHVSSEFLRRQLEPLAAEFGAVLQICFCHDEKDALRHLLSHRSAVVVARRRPWWRGYRVALEFISTEKNNA